MTKSFDDALSASAFRIEGARDLYMEIMEPATNHVWMTVAPISREAVEAFQPEAPFVKMGAGRAAMDCAAFLHSPHSDAPRLMSHGGLDFIHVAIPGEVTPPDGQDGPMRARVDKAHVLGFEAGRRLSYLDGPDGQYIEVIGTDENDGTRIFPDGFELKATTLEVPLTIELPTPTDALFWVELQADGAYLERSFQGPVRLNF